MKQKKLIAYPILILFLVFCSLGCSFKIGKGDKVWNDFVAPHRKLADMGNYKMHYIDIGKGKPIVLVHGFSAPTAYPIYDEPPVPSVDDYMKDPEYPVEAYF